MASLLDIPSVRQLVNLRRFGIALLVASSIALPGAAEASGERLANDPRDDAPSCAEAATTGPPIPLAGAVLTPRPVEGGLRWDARFILDVEAAFDFRGGVLPLAVPLPTGMELIATPGLAALESDGRIAGLCVARDALHDRTVSVSFLQHLLATGPNPVELGAPVAAGSAVQIIETSIGEKWIEPIATSRLERHVGYVAPRAISGGAREEARRLTGVPAKVSTSPIYVRGDDVHTIGGLSARIVDPKARARGSALGAGIVFVGIVGALVLAARKLRDTASVERADALLASQIDDVACFLPEGPPPRQDRTRSSVV
jgi:hypothetical protein